MFPPSLVCVCIVCVCVCVCVFALGVCPCLSVYRDVDERTSSSPQAKKVREEETQKHQQASDRQRALRQEIKKVVAEVSSSHTHASAHTYARTHTRTHAHTHARTRARAHTRTHHGRRKRVYERARQSYASPTAFSAISSSPARSVFLWCSYGTPIVSSHHRPMPHTQAHSGVPETRVRTLASHACARTGGGDGQELVRLLGG